MITSKHITQISEEYLKSGSGYRHKQVTVYKNPTSSDYLQLAKEARDDNRRLEAIRFVADNRTKTIYVADEYSSLHDDIRSIAKLPPPGATTTLGGIAYVYGSRAVFKELSTIEPEVAEAKLWTWVDKYISNFSNYAF